MPCFETITRIIRPILKLRTPVIITGMITALLQPLEAKSYRLEQVSVHARILPDGNLRIEESRTYDFTGSFSWADYRIPLVGISDIRDFSMRDEQIEYVASESGEAGTYSATNLGDEFYVLWHYHAAHQKRTFLLRYLATDAVIRHDDGAEFYFKFVGESNLKQIGSVDVFIQLPREASFPEVRAWAHGPLWGSVRFEGGKILLQVQPLPAGQFWEARLFFPAEWVPQASRVSREMKLDQILQEEDALASAANLKREEARRELEERQAQEALGWKIIPFLIFIAGLVVFLLYAKFGKSHPVNFYQPYSSELPENEPPAITSGIFHSHQIYGAALTATLFDLARRGFVKIEQISPAVKKWWGKTPPVFSVRATEAPRKNPKDTLLDFESNLLDFIFNELGEGKEEVDFRVFRKKQSAVQRWFKEWERLVKAHFKDIPLHDKTSIRGMVFALIISLVTLGLGILLSVLVGTPGVPMIIAGGILLIFSFFIIRYTPESRLRMKKLNALKVYLKKYHYLDPRQESQWLQNIDKYLIYGLALGIDKKTVEKMLGSLTSEQYFHVFPWYHYHAGSFSTPAEFASAISTMVSVASSTVSSSTGSGGGSSGGGGGGGGGASGGAG